MMGVSLFAPGCGELLDGRWEGEVLQRLSGTIEPGPGSAAGEVSVAVLWFPRRPPDDRLGPIEPPTPQCTGSPPAEVLERTVEERTAWVGEVLRFEPAFPLNFELPLRRVPPLEARVRMGDATVSAGILLAFVDADGSGSYLPPSLGRAGDPLVALSYAEGRTQTLLFTQGGVEVEERPGAPLTDGFHIAESGPGIDDLYLPPSAPIRMTMPEEAILLAQLRNSLCETRVIELTKGGWPQAGDEVFCGSEGRIWLSRGYAIDLEDPCRVALRTSAGCLGPEAAPPPDWPCEP